MKIRYNSPVVLTHAGWSHFKGNLIMILLIGPLLEEKYGSWLIFEMMVITAAATALINAAIFHHPCGGSGLVFIWKDRWHMDACKAIHLTEK